MLRIKRTPEKADGRYFMHVYIGANARVIIKDKKLSFKWLL